MNTKIISILMRKQERHSLNQLKIFKKIYKKNHKIKIKIKANKMNLIQINIIVLVLVFNKISLTVFKIIMIIYLKKKIPK
jgi:hypothetical protein